MVSRFFMVRVMALRLFVLRVEHARSMYPRSVSVSGRSPGAIYPR